MPSSADVAPLREAAGDRVRVTGLAEPDRTGMEAIRGARRRRRAARARFEDLPARAAAAAHELIEDGRAGGELVLAIDSGSSAMCARTLLRPRPVTGVAELCEAGVA